MAWDGYLNDKLKIRRYQYRNEAKRDILYAIGSFNDLHPEEDLFTYDGKQTTLICLSGTIPVDFKGALYNIPILIKILQGHPHQAPLVLVKPTRVMRVNTSRYVDSNGKVCLPFLTEWGQGRKSTLCELIVQLQEIFSQYPPVVTVSSSLAPQLQPVSSDLAQKNIPLHSIPIDNAFRMIPGWCFQNETKRDILDTMKSYGDLQIQLVNQNIGLTGTIPVSYHSSSYNIPIMIQIHNGYPHQPPSVHVKPTSKMVIHPGPHVNNNGMVNVPILTQWQNQGGTGSLIELVKQLQLVFSQVMPVYTKPAQTVQLPSMLQQRPYPRAAGLTTTVSTNSQISPHMIHERLHNSAGAIANQNPNLGVPMTNPQSDPPNSLVEQMAEVMSISSTGNSSEGRQTSQLLIGQTVQDQSQNANGECSRGDVEDRPDF